MPWGYHEWTPGPGTREVPMSTTRVLLWLSLFALLGCGGGSSSPSSTAPAGVVQVSPPTATLQIGQTQAFSATVDGVASTSVAWSVLEAGGGTVTAGGSYTAPSSTGLFHVQAALSANPTHTGQAAVSVVVPTSGVPGLGIGAPLNGYLPFPADNPWNQDISALPADPSSDAIIAFVGTTTGLHADFGSGLYDGAPIGIPYAVVAAGQAPVAVAYVAYGGESDPGPMPIPSPPPYEGVSPTDTSGDRHVLVMDRDSQFLYELYGAQLQPDGTWQADSGAIWDLETGGLRPYGWTSADAAGLPIFPGLAEYEKWPPGPSSTPSASPCR